MARAFGPAADLAVKATISAGALGLVCLGLWAWWGPWSDYSTQVDMVQPQPVPFSHKHHVSDLGLDCRYCHTAVEVSSNAGLPPIETCMTCHSQVWTNATMLEPVRQAFATGRPIRWRAVNYLPDYVYFDHSIHVAKGVGCTTCHGPIGDMPLTRKAQTLTMSWCLDCHRDPAPRLRPHDAVFDPHWTRTPDTPSGEALLAAYHIHPATLTDCSVCHR